MIEKSVKHPRGIRNNNPLNIRRGSQWKGLKPKQTDPAFCQFESMQMGIRAAYRLMRNHILGFGGTRPRMNTLKKLISVWAPPSENATDKYVRHVSTFTGIEPNAIIDPNDRTSLVNIAREMAFVENGLYLDKSLFESAFDLLVV